MHDFVTYFMLLGALSSGGSLPFWAVSNQYGLMPESNGALAVAHASTSFDESRTFQWKWTAGLAAAADADGVKPMVDELCVSLRWKVLRADIGMQHREKEFLGADSRLGSLSISEGHIVESNNARAMPGYKLTLEPVSVPFTKNHLKLSGSWGDYKTLDDRYVDGALVHRMAAYLRYDINPQWFVQLGLDHYAIWGGSSPKYGDMGASFSNYLRVVTGRSAGESGTVSDQINVLGDHGGAEQLRAGWKGAESSVTFQYEKPYNDKSGMRLANIPDGIYTLHYSLSDKDRWISDLLFEYKYTMWQSGARHDPEVDEDGNKITTPGYYLGGDNYFCNGEYRSGWTYYGRSICDPLFTVARDSDGVMKIRNTRMQAWHAGVSGKLFRKIPYKLMLTYSWNYGSYSSPYVGKSTWQTDWQWWQKNDVDTPLRQVSGAFVAELPMGELASGKASRLPLSFVLGIYADRGQLLEDVFGAVVGIRYAISNNH